MAEPALMGQPLEGVERDVARMRDKKALLASVVLCRHGSTDYAPDRFYDRGDGPPLNDAGLSQAEALGRWFVASGVSVDSLYVSPTLRTRQTVAPIERVLSMTAEVVDGLSERSVGEWDGRLVEEVRNDDPEGWRQWKSEPVAFAPPGGESLLEFCRRIDEAISSLISRHPGGLIVLMTHVGPIRSVLGAALGCPPEYGKRFVIEPGSIARIEYTTSWPNVAVLGIQPP